jgi:tRNA dimethylallyltransferase
LHRRIHQRVTAWLAAGGVEEVRQAMARGLAAEAPGLDAVGYREIVRFVQGDLESGRLVDAIVISTRRYAKRQETWFRHQLGGAPVLTLDAAEPADRLASRLVHHWESTYA